MKILNVLWFGGRDTIGIVQVEDEYDGTGYYIGSIAMPTTEEEDSRYIADWGTTFPKDAGDVLFGYAGVEQ